MTHRFSAGQDVYYEAPFTHNAARGTYKIIRPLPVENNNKIAYRIKSAAESFERIAEESELTRAR